MTPVTPEVEAVYESLTTDQLYQMREAFEVDLTQKAETDFTAGRLELIARILATRLLYSISQGGESITCGRCRKTSHNPHDVANLYCGFCKVFHHPSK